MTTSSEEYENDFILRAAYIKRCVPDLQFSTALALWCAGMAPDIAELPRFTDLVLNCSQALKDVIAIESNITNIIAQAKILVSHARRVPNKINKFGIPSTTAKARGSNALTDYCRLVGFTNDFLSGAQRPKYQQVFCFSTKIYERQGTCIKDYFGMPSKYYTLFALFR